MMGALLAVECERLRDRLQQMELNYRYSNYAKVSRICNILIKLASAFHFQEKLY
jgi:hypothetical protein